MEFQVRNARLTDVEAAVRLFGLDARNAGAGRDAADVLRQLLYLPSATVVVAVSGRDVVGAGVLSIRPSVRAGSLLGAVDELGVLSSDAVTQRLPEDAHSDADVIRRRIARAVLDELTRSARNKGCARLEVSQAAAGNDAEFWTAAGFRRGRARLEQEIR